MMGDSTQKDYHHLGTCSAAMIHMSYKCIQRRCCSLPHSASFAHLIHKIRIIASESGRTLTAVRLPAALHRGRHQLRPVAPHLFCVPAAVIGAEAAGVRLAEQAPHAQGLHLAPSDGLQVAGDQAGHDAVRALRVQVE